MRLDLPHEADSRSTEFTFFSDLRASMSGKGVPEDVKSRVLGLHEDNVQLREQLKTVQDKLTKARTVRGSLLQIPLSFIHRSLL